MRRAAQDYLDKWFVRSHRMPLIIRGARQVGKSTLVELFCDSKKIDLIAINLEKDKIKSLARERLDLQNVLDEIQLKTGKRITTNSLVFFDEVQEQPKLLSFLRYFYEERPDIAVIAAGSLLEIALRAENFSFPVGRVEFYHLGPLSFKEFLWATGRDFLQEKIEKLDFSDVVHELAKESFRNYLYVGGMPKAVDTFAKEKSLVSVRFIQEQILQSYIADFPKYNSKINVERIHRIFHMSVRQLGKKVIYQRFDTESQSRDVKRALELLIQAKVLLACYHSDANSVPLAGEADYAIQKLYFIDVGLMNSLLRVDPDVIDQEMKNKFNTKGMMAEQFVAQHLTSVDGNSMPPQLFYWLRDKGSQKGEVDFLVERHAIIPVEVKSVGAGHLKSAFYFAKEKRSQVLIRLSLQPYQREHIQHKIGTEVVKIQLISLPIYAVEYLLKSIECPA